MAAVVEPDVYDHVLFPRFGPDCICNVFKLDFIERKGVDGKHSGTVIYVFIFPALVHSLVHPFVVTQPGAADRGVSGSSRIHPYVHILRSVIKTYCRCPWLRDLVAVNVVPCLQSEVVSVTFILSVISGHHLLCSLNDFRRRYTIDGSNLASYHILAADVSHGHE